MEKDVCKKHNCTNTNANHRAKYLHVCRLGANCPKKNDAKHQAECVHQAVKGIGKKGKEGGCASPEGKPKGKKGGSKARFTGVELSPESRGEVLRAFKMHWPGNWTVKADHMTMNLGGFNPELKPTVELGQEITLKVVALGKNEQAVAVKVEGDVPCTNKAVPPGGKPVQSNYIQDWRETQDELVLHGHVREFK